jgi:hypothetical protein
VLKTRERATFEEGWMAHPNARVKVNLKVKEVLANGDETM